MPVNISCGANHLPQTPTSCSILKWKGLLKSSLGNVQTTFILITNYIYLESLTENITVKYHWESEMNVNTLSHKFEMRFTFIHNSKSVLNVKCSPMF